MNHRILQSFYLLAAVFCCLICAGCPQTFPMEMVMGEDGKTIIFKWAPGIRIRSLDIVSRLLTPEDAAGNRFRVVQWRIEVQHAEGAYRHTGVELAAVHYGKQPDGFKQIVPPRELEPGKYYDVNVRSANKGSASGLLRITRKGDRMTLGNDKSLWDKLFGSSTPKGLIPDALRREAEAGDPRAQYEMGERFFDGDGLWNDVEESYKWFRRAAQQGHVKAWYKMGELSLHSFVKSADRRKDSFDWHFKAAQKGYPPAMVKVALAHKLGTGVKRDAAVALLWFRKAAELGNVEGMRYLASCYRNGFGVEKNIPEADKWTQKVHAVTQPITGVAY